MIKKFKEYYEGRIPVETNDSRVVERFTGKRLNPILSIEEVDDQFLRLEEVLNCKVDWDYISLSNVEYGNVIYLHVTIPREITKDIVARAKLMQSKDSGTVIKYSKIYTDVISELRQIEKRIEVMHPEIKITFRDYGRFNGVNDYVITITISRR